MRSAGAEGAGVNVWGAEGAAGAGVNIWGAGGTGAGVNVAGANDGADEGAAYDGGCDVRSAGVIVWEMVGVMVGEIVMKLGWGKAGIVCGNTADIIGTV